MEKKTSDLWNRKNCWNLIFSSLSLLKLVCERNVDTQCSADLYEPSTESELTIVFLVQIDANGDGFINVTELRNALDVCGFKMPGYKVRQMIEEYDDKQRLEHRGRLSFEEFEKLCKELKANELGSTFKQVVSKKENLETLGGISEASSEGTTHSVRLEEQLAFSDWINTNLAHDPDLKHLLPIDPEGKMLYEKVKDGILLW